MSIRPIRTDDDHEGALREIDRLWGAEQGTPEGDVLDVLLVLVSDYEDKRWPVEAVSPHDILAFAIEEMGRSQKELADLLGSRSQASELLGGKKRVSLDVARRISAAWKIPIQLLVAEDHRDEIEITKTSMKMADRGPITEYKLRLDRATIDKFKATGTDWQERINNVLRSEATKLQ